LKAYYDKGDLGIEPALSPTYETNLALNHKNMLAVGDVLWDVGTLNRNQFVRTATDQKRKGDFSKMPKAGDFKHGYAPFGTNLHLHTGFEGGGALADTTVTNSKTKKTVGTIPTYAIARFVPRIDGILQYRLFTFESDLTGRYLFTTETTAVNDKAGNPYIKTVKGWKAVNVGTVTFGPSDQHYAFSVAYTNGFSAPTYQRANGVKIGVQVKY
jgi:hypothetical protein